jgi:class 3 adenylate cyclase
VAYSRAAKLDTLGMPSTLYTARGSVHREAVKAMAEGVRRLSGAQVGVGESGVAGPSGGSSGLAIGTVWAAVMFCDLADSTRLAGQIDPEDYRTVVRAYQGACAELIQRFDGYIAQYLGDGLLVYFGYPKAHEDDAQRAVHTGLGVLPALERLNTRLVQDTGSRLAVRIGIHTGLVVVGKMGSGGRHEHLALGDTPNVAARLQGFAAPDTVVISEVTARLVHGYFTAQDLEPHALKGMDTPVRIFQIGAASAAQGRLEAATATGLTPLVGREAEVVLLRERWAQSTDGRG